MKSSLSASFLSFSCLLKWFFHENLGFILFFVLSSSLSTFGLLSSYCGVWFVIGLLRCGAAHRLVETLYLCGGDSDRQRGFDRSKISNYGRQYVEELESKIF